jgi:hypothetical protein
MSLPSHQAPPGRHVGVMVAGSQTAIPADQKVYGKKNSLVGLMEMRTFVLLYNDATGLQQKPHVVHEFGGKFYTAPNAIDWGASLRELEPWLMDLAAKRLAQLESTSSAPPDLVDIMPEEKG